MSRKSEFYNQKNKGVLSFEIVNNGLSVRYGVRPLLDKRINFASEEDASKFMELVISGIISTGRGFK